jgi:hypothetical protein
LLPVPLELNDFVSAEYHHSFIHNSICFIMTGYGHFIVKLHAMALGIIIPGKSSALLVHLTMALLLCIDLDVTGYTIVTKTIHAVSWP